MKNVREIRDEKNLYYIISGESLTGSVYCYEDTAIMIYLYYEDSMEKYSGYIDNIPENIHVYIISSNEELYEPILEYIKKNKNRKIELIKKKNRGRDISALLVAGREVCLKYKYICFVHDKRKKEGVPDSEFDLWIENLWGNSLGGEAYIRNVLSLLEINDEIGVLAPPEPLGIYIKAWYVNSWGENNFVLANQLAKELNLECNLDIDKSPITFGTVFWAKSIALRKLFEKEWKYEDFDDEPLGEETISHAIERIIGYVAQDAGYDTGTLMNTTYAGKMLSYTQQRFLPMYQLLVKDYCINDIDFFLNKQKYIYDFCKKNKKVYLYGAGKIGRGCLHFLRAGGFEPTGFIVTKKNQKDERIEGLFVEELESVEDIAEIGIIVTVGRKLADEVEENLKLRKIENYIKYLG